MRLRFLGTSAGELYPGIWCRCRNCEAARHGSTEDRRQSAALYVETKDAEPAGLLIDFPPEIASQALRHGVPLWDIRHLLVTHSHGDHWFPYQLRWRTGPMEIVSPAAQQPVGQGGARFTELPMLQIWGNEEVGSILERELGRDLEPFQVEFHRLYGAQSFQAGPWTVSSLKANHDVGREDAVHYAIEGRDRAILYALDGDTFLQETREALKTYRFDAVIMESTYGHGDGRNHRNFARLIAEADWIRSQGLLREGGKIIATHFSPHHCPPHAECTAFLAIHKIQAAWDGMELAL